MARGAAAHVGFADVQLHLFLAADRSADRHGMLWLHEQPGMLTAVGGVITILGEVLANTRRRIAVAPAVAVESR